MKKQKNKKTKNKKQKTNVAIHVASQLIKESLKVILDDDSHTKIGWINHFFLQLNIPMMM